MEEKIKMLIGELVLNNLTLQEQLEQMQQNIEADAAKRLSDDVKESSEKDND